MQRCLYCHNLEEEKRLRIEEWGCPKTNPCHEPHYIFVNCKCPSILHHVKSTGTLIENENSSIVCYYHYDENHSVCRKIYLGCIIVLGDISARVERYFDQLRRKLDAKEFE